LNLSTILSLAALQYPNSVSQPNSLIFLNECQNTIYRRFDFPEETEMVNLINNMALYTLPSYIKPERIRNVAIIEPSQQILIEDDEDDQEDQEFPSEYDLEGSLGEYEYCGEQEELSGNNYGIINGPVSMLSLFPMPSIPGMTVGQINVAQGGTGYTSAPSVTLTGGGYSTIATATATVGNGAVTGVTITNAGAGYLFPPQISFAGVGTGATAVAFLTGLQMMITFKDGPNDLTSGTLTIVPRLNQDYHLYLVHKLTAWFAKLARDIDVANNFEADADDIYQRMASDLHYGLEEKLIPRW
jgi:hypothetical protein